MSVEGDEGVGLLSTCLMCILILQVVGDEDGMGKDGSTHGHSVDDVCMSVALSAYLFWTERSYSLVDECRLFPSR